MYVHRAISVAYRCFIFGYILLLSLKGYWRGPALIEMGSYESRLSVS